MVTDAYGTMGFTQDEIVSALRKNPKIDIEDIFVVDGEKYEASEKNSTLNLPHINDWNKNTYDISPEEYHIQLQDVWLMPEEYVSFDIEHYLLSLCKNTDQVNRVNEELELYRKFNLLNLLKYLRYLRNAAIENNIVWGVGRGSSCSSYCLFLLQIHRVDSLLFKLDVKEFLRS